MSISASAKPIVPAAKSALAAKGTPALKSAPVGKGQAASTDASIASIYNQLIGNLGHGLTAQSTDFGRASQLVGSSYDQLGQLLKEGARATVGGLNGQFAQLGIGAASDSATQGIRNEFNQGMISAARRKATDVAGLDREGAEYNAIGHQGIDNANREEAQTRADSATKIQQAIDAMMGARATAQGQVDLAGVQGQTALAQLKGQIQLAQIKAQQTQDPLAQLKAEKLGAEVQVLEHKLSGTGTDKPDRKWLSGYNNYLVGIKASPNFKLLTDAIINRAYSSATNPILNIPGVNHDPYALAMADLASYGGMFNKDKLAHAIQIAFGKVG